MGEEEAKEEGEGRQQTEHPLTGASVQVRAEVSYPNAICTHTHSPIGACCRIQHLQTAQETKGKVRSTLLLHAMLKNAQYLGPRVPSGAWVIQQTHESRAESLGLANPFSFLAAEDSLCPGSFASLAPQVPAAHLVPSGSSVGADVAWHCGGL